MLAEQPNRPDVKTTRYEAYRQLRDQGVSVEEALAFCGYSAEVVAEHLRGEASRLKRKNGFLCWGLVTLSFAFVFLFLYAVGSGMFATATVSGLLGIAAFAGGARGES